MGSLMGIRNLKIQIYFSFDKILYFVLNIVRGYKSQILFVLFAILILFLVRLGTFYVCHVAQIHV